MGCEQLEGVFSIGCGFLCIYLNKIPSIHHSLSEIQNHLNVLHSTLLKKQKKKSNKTVQK